jgi:hypothetical protein
MARPKAPAQATAKKVLTMFRWEEPSKVADELDAVVVPSVEVETDAETDEVGVVSSEE